MVKIPVCLVFRPRELFLSSPVLINQQSHSHMQRGVMKSFSVIPAGSVSGCFGADEAEPEGEMLVLRVKCMFQRSPVIMTSG